jgi:hypothetical protein
MATLVAWGCDRSSVAAVREPRYACVRVLPSSGGFGVYTVEASKPAYSEAYELSDLLPWMREGEGELFELGVDDLPAEARDIRGRIENEPSRVFARVVHRNSPPFASVDVTYEGIVEVLPV